MFSRIRDEASMVDAIVANARFTFSRSRGHTDTGNPDTMSIFRLDGKTAVVTGGGSGIGRAISILFAQQGAYVRILERDVEAAADAVRVIEQGGGRAKGHGCDVAQQSNVDATFQAIVEETGRVDILVNNAGIAHIGNVLDTTEEDLDRIYAVNVKGVYNSLRAGVRQMLTQGGGAILNMASTVSLMGIDDRFAYSMSKGAVHTMTLSTARDFITQNIRCNCLCPARVHTPFVDGYLDQNYPDNREEMFHKLSIAQPIGRMAKPEEIAHAALYLCSDEASFVTGCAYPIDGGSIHVR